MRAFIIRPFGTQEGVDFDAVEERLIGPALDAQPEEPEGRTTGEILRSGNIRTDMFEAILGADLVVADLSIHNANVFYELGIRHALRDKKTVLIRCSVEGHEVPFDLKTDRYLRYDRHAPEKAVGALTDVIRRTIASDEADSPVFQLLPTLRAVDPRHLIVVPQPFSEEVEYAGADRDRGRLRLLAEEVGGLGWEVAGLRRIGATQFMLKDWEGARESLEAVTELYPNDVEANTLLGTTYQRLGDLAKSSVVVERVLESEEPSPYERAELRSLRARNQKSLWEAEWRSHAELEDRQLVALRSGHLEACAREYEAAFEEDRNHFYSGLNALAMNRVLEALARTHSDIWAERFEEDEEAEAALRRLDRAGEDLAAAVKLSVISGIERLTRTDSVELPWAKVSRADLTFLTSSKSSRVAQAYRLALVGAADFVRSAARRQVLLYEELGLFEENTKAALELLPALGEPAAPSPRVLIFTGHRIDSPDRGAPRFPAGKEDLARGWIREAVSEELAASGERDLVGISGGASGGDILFHEVCAEFGIQTEMYLALPEKEYIAASVADGGPEWVRRFNALVETTEPRVLGDSADLPKWLRTKKDYGVWQRSNLWLLHTGFAMSDRVSLIALWDGEAGDGPGGTKDMVDRARERGARVVILDAKRLVE